MAQIVIGVDESEGAAAALRWAVDEGDLRGWSLTAVLAWGLLDQHHPTPDHPFDPHYDEQAADACLAAVLERTVGAEVAAKIERRVVCDLPARALVEAAQGAELLVLGARGLGGFRGLLLGSVTDQCLQHSTSPVAVIRRRTVEEARTRDGRPVVAGVDGSETSRRALRWALDEGRARQAPVRVVHAWQPPYLSGYPFAPVPADTETFHDAASEMLHSMIDGEDTSGLPAPVEPMLVSGGAASAILDVAGDAQLVVVGSRGTGGFSSLLLGSVSHQVARHAPCPVIVVPPAG